MSDTPDLWHIYVIGQTDGLKKIGISRKPQRRLHQLQVSSPVKLRIEHFVACSKDDAEAVEQKAHAILSEHRHSGEWFAVTAEAAIASIEQAALALGVELHAPEPSVRKPGGRPAKEGGVRYFRALLDPRASGCGVIFPELPGCISHGSDADHAARMAAAALAGHIAAMIEDGDALPEPVSMDAPLPDWVPCEPGESLIYLLVPVELPGKALRINITMEDDLAELVDKAAQRRGMSRSAFLAEGARRLLAEA